MVVVHSRRGGAAAKVTKVKAAALVSPVIKAKNKVKTAVRGSSKVKKEPDKEKGAGKTKKLKVKAVPLKGPVLSASSKSNKTQSGNSKKKVEKEKEAGNHDSKTHSSKPADKSKQKSTSSCPAPAPTGIKSAMSSKADCSKSSSSGHQLVNCKSSPTPASQFMKVEVSSSKTMVQCITTSQTNGPRIHAQRKFAHAGNTYSGTLGLHHSASNQSSNPASKEGTPMKRAHDGSNSVSSTKKVKKPMFSPPPCKRPKTEDFLTFLCVRGTSHLPPSLDFFNYPQAFDSDTHSTAKKKICPQTIAQSVFTSSSIEVKESCTIKLTEEQRQVTCNANGKSKTAKYSKQPNKEHSTSKDESSSKKPTNKLSSTNSVSTAENPTKGIRATASSVLLSKMKKSSSSTKTKPILSPPLSRLNEQDARFAMTALKLKYQRLVQKPKRSVLLTKKAKENIILTRSKSRPLISYGTLTSPKKGKGKLGARSLKPTIISPSRNAPSPDIIFGVTSSAVRKQAKSRSSSSSGSESEEEDESSGNASTDEKSDGTLKSDDECRSKKANFVETARSLRNGKELKVPKPKTTLKEKSNDEEVATLKTASSKQEKESMENRVGTRSAHRLSKSPLREIPMYKKNKKLNKKLEKQKKSKKDKEDALTSKTNKAKQKSDDPPKSSAESKLSASKKGDRFDDGKRPQRKTKETATNLLGLLNHGFSTDEESNDEKRDKNEESEVGSSSSSETNYLEKHYKTALKREEEKFLSKKNDKSEVRTRSSRHDSNTDCSAKKKISKSERNLRSKGSKPLDDLNVRKNQPSKKVESKTKDKPPSSNKPSTRQSTPTVDERKMSSAVRKSATIVCKGRRQQASESEASSSEEENSGSDSDNESSSRRTKVKKTQKLSERNRQRKRYKAEPVKKKNDADSTDSSDAASEVESDSDEVDNLKKLSDSEKSDNDNDGSNRHSTTSAKSKSQKNVKPAIWSPVEMTRTTSSARSTPSSVSTKIKRERSISTRSSSEDDTQYNSQQRSARSRSSSRSSCCSEVERHQEHQDSSTSTESEEETVEKVDMATQVDMDEEEQLASPLKVEKSEKVTHEGDETDNDVEEIGRIFATPSTSSQETRRSPTVKNKDSHRHRQSWEEKSRIHNRSPPPVFHSDRPGPSSRPLPSNQFIPPPAPPPLMDPLLNNPFSPFLHRPPTSLPLQDFYTPLHLNPPMVHSSIQLVGNSLAAPSFPIASPLNTLSIPVSMPFSSHILPHHPGIGFATGSTFHSTTMQTHIRSVATNLDIPLVRPTIGEHTGLNFMHRGPTISANTPLTRPSVPGVSVNGLWGQHLMDTSSAERAYYSAFRVPPPCSATATHTTTQHVIHQSTTVLGVNSSSVLPVSIIQPHTQQHTHNQVPPPTYHHQSFENNSSSSHTTHAQSSRHHKEGDNSSQSLKKRKSEETLRSYRPIQEKKVVTPAAAATATTASTSRPKSPTPPGYHLIKHLPNVSIVPKFDRTAPGAEQAYSGKKRKDLKNDPTAEKREKKKPGRKPKESVTLPHPTSPLTVKKDTNPATYAPKKQSSQQDSDSGDLPRNNHFDRLKEEQDHDSPGTKAKTIHETKKKPKDKGNSSSPVIKKNGTGSAMTKVKSPTKKKESHASASTSADIVSNGLQKSSSSATHTSRVSSPSTKTKSSSSSSTGGSKNGIIEAPAFRPTEEEFEDPLKYFQKIQAETQKYGIARIIPPKSFRPECNVEDDMRFTAYNHYIHKMYQRWGPLVIESEAIKQNLKQSEVDVSEVVMIGGMEINLATLFQTVKSFGGLKEVIEKQKWTKVADSMHVPKAAHDRATKVDSVYMKYVLPYEILSEDEREKLKKKCEKKWLKRREKVLKAQKNDEDIEGDSMDEVDECIIKGKTTPLSTYYRVARNTFNVFFSEKERSADEIEEEYWKIVRDRNRHVCVYSGSIDCAGVGWGFPIPKASSKHPWNLKVLANNQGSVLRSMGPVMGATVPTLHVAMLFTSYCWYRDPHCLPWVEYLHSGANKIWYSVPSHSEDIFRSTVTELMPVQCKKKKIWLASDSAMVPPEVLLEKGVPLVRATQRPGEFLVIHDKAYTSAICTGYLISESVCFAFPTWLNNAVETFKDIQKSREPPVFPLEKLLLSILQDARASLDIVRHVLADAVDLVKVEIGLRKKIVTMGIKYGGKITTDSDTSSNKSKRVSKKKQGREEELEQCYNCNYTLFLSMVRINKTEIPMCLKHAVDYYTKHKAETKKSVLLYDLDDKQLEAIVDNARKRCGTSKSKSPDKKCSLNP